MEDHDVYKVRDGFEAIAIRAGNCLEVDSLGNPVLSDIAIFNIKEIQRIALLMIEVRE